MRAILVKDNNNNTRIPPTSECDLVEDDNEFRYGMRVTFLFPCLASLSFPLRRWGLHLVENPGKPSVERKVVSWYSHRCLLWFLSNRVW